MNRNLPTPDEWTAWAQADPHMKAVSRGEWAGPCPSCKGTDRFRVNKAGAFCRICCPDGSAVYRDAYREACRAAGFLIESPETGRSRPAPRPRPAPAPEQKPRTADSVAAILKAAVGPVGTPAETYLVNDRRVWPPEQFAPHVKWMGRAASPLTGQTCLPDSAAGAAVFPITGRDGRAVACQLEALSGGGRRTGWPKRDRWRCTFGPRKGGVYVAHRPPLPPSRVIVAEGPVSALAAWWMQRERYALVIAAMGTVDQVPGWCFPDGVPVTVQADSGKAGRNAANSLRGRLQARGIDCTAIHRKEGDPADELRAIVNRDGWTEALLAKGCTS